MDQAKRQKRFVSELRLAALVDSLSRSESARLSTQINQILRSHMEGKESVDAKKRWFRMIDFIRAVEKRVKGIIGNATQERLSLCAYFKKSRNTKKSFAAKVRY